MFVTDVVRDSIQPGRERGIPAESVAVSEHAQKSLGAHRPRPNFKVVGQGDHAALASPEAGQVEDEILEAHPPAGT